MAKKKLYKTIIQIEILSEDPIDGNPSLSDIEYNINDGSWSGVVETKSTTTVTGKKAVEAVQNQGTDPSFFMMDENGNEDDDYLNDDDNF
jgi:hypothetical protein